MPKPQIYKKPDTILHHEQTLGDFDSFVTDCTIESLEEPLTEFRDAYAELLNKHNKVLEELYRHVHFHSLLVDKYGPLHHVEVTGTLAAIEDIYRRATRDDE